MRQIAKELIASGAAAVVKHPGLRYGSINARASGDCETEKDLNIYLAMDTKLNGLR